MQVNKHKLLIHMNDKQGNIQTLTYNIFNTDVATRWVNIVKKNINNPIKTILQNMTAKDINSLREKLDGCVHTINKYYDKKLPLHGDVEQLDTEILNYLHEEFEVYGDRIEDLTVTNPVDWWNKELHEAFLQLNNYIHNYEDINHLIKEGGFPNMAGLFDHLPAGEHSPLEDSDYLYMTTQFVWGGLYLGYNTLGKDFLAIAKDNDIEVLDRDQVRPQQRFATEAWMSYNADSDDSPWNLMQWDHWYKGLTDEQRSKIPVDSRRNLGLGRIWIGSVNLNTLPKRKLMEPDLDKWRVSNSDLRARWNTEVFGTFTDIHSIEIK